MIIIFESRREMSDWNMLTEFERQSWKDFAIKHQRKFIDRFQDGKITFCNLRQINKELLTY